MTWNYRVMYFANVPEPYCAVHEVHYNEDGTVKVFGENPAVLAWNLDEGFDVGSKILEMMQSAFAKPVLCPEDFKGGE